MSFSAKLISAGVIGKAILMGVLVSVLAVTSFEKSIILVLVSACATGIFGIIIVLIQTHAEAGLHQRIDSLEGKTDALDTKADVITEKATNIESAVTPEGKS
jgi:divalent metal cation (Fe/Co/Zn/Cd) transporter